ncbi:MAG: alpha-xylosidase [Bacteroidales bacterium]|nr:alpha-xylosidase [Bacteroidales bacterium]
MKQTNYHLFDFLDFDPQLQADESLWTACRPTRIESIGGTIEMEVPFQRQLLQNDMQADTDAPREVHRLQLRLYNNQTLRLTITLGHPQLAAQTGDLTNDEMLSYEPSVHTLPLQVRLAEQDLYEVVGDDGRIYARLDNREPVLDPWSDLLPAPQETLALTLYPEGNDKAVHLSAYDHFSPPRYDALPLAYVRRNGRIDSTTLSVECLPDECFVGSGERFTKMDLSGRTFQLKNQDGQGVNNRRCYKNVPFCMSNRMYGLFYHTSAYSKLSLADHSTRSVQMLSEEPQMDLFVIGGEVPERIQYHYRQLTGFSPMLPLWSFGIWMSRMSYFSADEVQAICDRLRREHYPCDVIHLDTGWFRTDWLCEWKFNEERFPDPRGFVQGLLHDGFRVSLWQLPYVAEEAEQLDEAVAHQYIAPRPNRKSNGSGSNFSTLDYAGTIDFTNPEAVEWYQGLLRRLLDLGVTCIKTDFGENIHMDAHYHDGRTPEQLNNIYSILYQRSAWEVTRQVCGDGIVWGRSAWAGGQRYPLHWGGDSAHSWDGMAGSLKGGLHFGLSGFSFWSHDVPGFHSLPNFMNSPLHDDIYVRWTQFGVFTSHMRYHGTCKREPWEYPAIAPIVRRWWQLRYRLMPYIVQQAEQCTHSGYPMVRALLYHHPDDVTVWHIDDEYYFGDSFLVCPVMNSDNRRDIYLPEGEWVHFFTGQKWQGGRWYKQVEVPLEQMPVFVHPGTVIPVYPDQVECTDQMDLSRQTSLVIDEEFHGMKMD